jgi:2-methylcitrate dehydratase
MPARLRAVMRDGGDVTVEKHDYEGFVTRPMPWDGVVAKFDRLAESFTTWEQRRAIVLAVSRLEGIPVSELTGLLDAVWKEQPHE